MSKEASGPSYKLSVVVPVYNEEENVPAFLRRMRAVLDGLGCDAEIVFAMDPSTDRTKEVILRERAADPRVKLLEFTRRFGQPAATLAGLRWASGDASVVIDCDLQDPPELLPELVAKWREGYHVVYAQRRSRKGENPVRKAVAWTAYWLMNRWAEVPIPRNTGDFRLLSRRVVDELKGLKEGHGFLRGLVGFVGYSQVGVPYDRDERHGGATKYNRLLGSIKIGFNGLVGFSQAPLQLVSVLGVVLLLLGVVWAGALAVAWLLGSAPSLAAFSARASVALFPALLVLLGLQSLALGLMGAYLARIYDEVRDRPLYLVASAHGFDGKDGA